MLIRHAKAKPAEAGQKDKDRQLSDVGLQQAAARGAMADYSIVDFVLSSTAPRAFMTGCLVTRKSVDEIVTLEELYFDPDGEVGQQLDKLFNLPHLGYASVAKYLAEEGGDCVLAWAEGALPAIMKEIDSAPRSDIVAAFGHAICLPALAMAICKDNPGLVEQLAQINMGECGVIEIIFDDTGKPKRVLSSGN
jgi:broad specificity phosphatase PhoE